jgi:Glycosyl hydrolases family 2, TIM barrel domain
MKLYSFIILAFLQCIDIQAQTKVQKTANGFELMRNGKPYYVKGVGGQVNFDEMVAVGANSFRTWGIEGADELLEEAQKRNLTVMFGMWMQHERHGFDYSNADKVKQQVDHFKSVVDKYKNSPAILMWGIGNELDLDYSNPACWDAVQEIAKYIHEVDPNHPTSTVTAGLDSLEVAHIKKRCPDIDIYCVNTYGDIGNVPTNIQKFGWNGPYMITEWGPNGHWESPTTSWGVSIEQSSTEKYKVYSERYTKYLEPNKNYCLGSYAFLWGAKQEYTETWYGLFSKENLPTEPVDAIQQAFTGMAIANPSPTIINFNINNKIATDNITIKAEEKNEAIINVKLDAKNTKNAKYVWRIMQESTDKKSGGDAEEEAVEIGGLIHKKFGVQNAISFDAPKNEGNYRLFVSVIHNNKIAYSNIPFKVLPRNPNDKQVKFVQFQFKDMNSFEQN